MRGGGRVGRGSAEVWKGWVYIRCAGSGDRKGEQRNGRPGWPRYRGPGKSIGGGAGDTEGQE